MIVSNSSPKSKITVVENTLELQYGEEIRYIAPANAIRKRKKSQTDYRDCLLPAIRYLKENDPREDWEGVCEMCDALDDTVRYQLDDLVKGRNVLEIGLCTALPTVFAVRNGAKHVTLISDNLEIMESCVKPTLARNKIDEGLYEIVYSSPEDRKKVVKQHGYEVILAVDILNNAKNRFEEIHDIIDHAMDNYGICLLESQVFYDSGQISLADFMEMVKMKRKFEIFVRWSSPKMQVIQRKVIQLTRSMR
ncbi:unnamed protein product [Thelazia callipaeda]|uniref:Class I SAM-dependent methyltransferase n=1 Tax=Thelazia callipaeda TaxID=103827 RepID=A0A0N5D324_THECL|nr:unnamed protein product [Thelazia callipaeda]